MTYKLNPELRKITCPVVLRGIGEDRKFENGEIVAALDFPKRYIVETISAESGTIIVQLAENNQVNNINWVGEEAVSFF